MVQLCEFRVPLAVNLLNYYSSCLSGLRTCCARVWYWMQHMQRLLLTINSWKIYLSVWFINLVYYMLMKNSNVKKYVNAFAHQFSRCLYLNVDANFGNWWSSFRWHNSIEVDKRKIMVFVKLCVYALERISQPNLGEGFDMPNSAGSSIVLRKIGS